MVEKFEGSVPSQEEKLIFEQTEGGSYNSRPHPEDVLFELGLNTNSDHENWEQNALDNGHGEYVKNVIAAAEFCKRNGINTSEGVQKVVEQAKEEIK